MLKLIKTLIFPLLSIQNINKIQKAPSYLNDGTFLYIVSRRIESLGVRYSLLSYYLLRIISQEIRLRENYRKGEGDLAEVYQKPCLFIRGLGFNYDYCNSFITEC